MDDDYTKQSKKVKFPKGTIWIKTTNEPYKYKDAGGKLWLTKTRLEASYKNKPVPNEKGKPHKKFLENWAPYVERPDFAPPLLYHVDEVRKAVSCGELLIVVEGEDKADLLRSWGYKATCSENGANSWTMGHGAELTGLNSNVLIVPDNDSNGRHYADCVGRSLVNGRVKSLRLLVLPGLGESEDIIDWVEKYGGTKEQFEQLIKTEARDWKAFGPPRKTKDSPYEFEYASDIPVEPITWFWKNRLACRKVNVLFGPTEQGKSTLGFYFAAVASRGGEWPDGGHVPKGKFIIISGEDDWRDTIVPRLEVNEADKTQIVHLKMKGEWFDLTHDLPRLAATIKEIEGVIGVLIDPATAFLSKPGKTDSHRQSDVRAILGPLNELAAEFNLIILIVLHPNKDTKVHSIMAWISGSAAFGEAPRIVQLVIEDDKDESPNKRVLFLKAKNNLIPSDLDTPGCSASRLSPSFCNRRLSNDRSSRSCLRSGCSFTTALVRIIAPSRLMMTAKPVERSLLMQACSKIAKPPASRITYCFMIERHSLAPGSPKDDGGDGGVASTAILLMAKILTSFLAAGKISKSTLRMQGRAAVVMGASKI
jgi:hypothetical protein